MIYTDPLFFILLGFTFFLCLLRPQWRLAILTVSSIIFYAWISFVDVFVFLFFIFIVFLFSRALTWKPQRRNFITFLAIVFTLLHLIIWKYGSWTNTLVPLGISFYSLQTIAYLIDLNKKEVTQISLNQFLFFKTFFAQLVMGPIVRAKPMLRQMSHSRFLSYSNWVHGFTWFALGFFQKVFIADQVAPYVNQIFLSPTRYSLATLIAGGVGFIVQVNCDFAGYSHMAVGIGLIFGFRLPFNFYSPVYSRSPIEVWSRWHVTLTDFMRDYVFRPLVYYSQKKLQILPISYRGLVAGVVTFSILLCVFLLTGLWHEASLKFIVWGLYGACLFALTHIFIFSSFTRRLKRLLPGFLFVILSISITFVTSWISMVLFRSVDLKHFWIYLSSLNNNAEMQKLSQATEVIYSLLVAELVISFVIYFDLIKRERPILNYISKKLRDHVQLNRLKRVKLSILVILGIALMITAIKLSTQSSADSTFIYFQF